MTARFGRNKRRAARAAISEAQASERAAIALAGRYRDRCQHAESLLGEVWERIMRAVGSNSALLPAGLQPPPRSNRESWARFQPIQRDLDGFIAMTAEVPRLDTMVDRDVISLLRLVTIVEKEPARFRTLIRFFDNDEAPHPPFSGRAIWISDDALMRVGLMGSDIHQMATDIARRLISLPKRSERS